MLQPGQRLRYSLLFALALSAAALSLITAPRARGAGAAGRQRNTTAAAGAQRTNAAPKDDDDAPAYSGYKGVRVGMTADEARQKLGAPADKGDAQDFYAFSDAETAQVFYDSTKKVYAVCVIYMGAASGAPAAKAVLGADVEARPDGSAYRKVDYPKAGYWVSYSRTAGDAPMVTVTMQKKQ